MIRVNSIRIRQFRGIRDLTLDFKGQSFAVCGPNGTGKSAVVDALEFALTGNVSRLSGEARGEVSLKEHGPHVDMRNDPGKARVAVKVTIPSLSKTITIERTLKKPRPAKVTPRDTAILEVLRHLEAHPEIVLSRRELIRYVLATPGKRAEEVQALLHLDQVEKVRRILQNIANGCEKKVRPLDAAVTQAREQLARALDMSEFTEQKLLAAVNVQRLILGLSAFADLTETTSLRDGMAGLGAAQPQRISKAQALADIQAAREAIAEITGEATIKRVAEVTEDLADLANDAALAASARREAFYTTGMDIIDAEVCPFCDTPWEPERLKRHVQTKIEHLNEASVKRKAAETKIAPLIAALRKVQAAVKAVVDYAPLTTPPLSVEAVRDYIANCKTAITKLEAFFPLADTLGALAGLSAVAQGVLDTITELEKVVASLPEPTKQDAARDCLTVAQERFEVWHIALQNHKKAKEQAGNARLVSDTYAGTSDKVLAGMYAAVENQFALLYSFVNRHDEDQFQAHLIPSIGKLGFDVDFYGRGFFPPGAYHSEGHQDGMGLCLYLALMRHLQGDRFTFAVLDDVLMSVDSGHRREVCALLKKKFPNTQFIMTTHDPVWLRHMRTEGLIAERAKVQFRNWTVDQGPASWDDRDVWTEISDHLKQNDVRAAAALLRHYLEYVSAELCDRLRAPVQFRGDARYELGELLCAAIAGMRKLYKTAKNAANSWNQEAIVDQVATCESKFAQLAHASKAEEWQMNIAIHFNSWDNLTRDDFVPLVEAFRNLLRGFACSQCGQYLRVSPGRGASESVRCDCGKVNINLRKRKGGPKLPATKPSKDATE